MIRSLVTRLISILMMSTLILPVRAGDNFGDDLKGSLGELEESLNNNIIPNINTTDSAQNIQSLIVYIAQDILIPLFIIVGIIVAIAGFYKMFFSNDENAASEGGQTLARGVIGIIVMFSARYIVTLLVGTDGTEGILTDNGTQFNGTELIANIYDKLLYPLLNTVLYLIVGVLFVILLVRVITFIFGSREDTQKKSMTIIIRNTVGILIILLAKQIVNAVYGTREKILNQPTTTPIPGTESFWDNTPLLFEIINRVLGLTGLIIVIIIIVQGYKLLVKPDSADNISSIGKSIGYALVGLLVIGGGYAIINLFLIQ